MKYVIKKNNDKKLANYNVKIDGLSVNPINNVKSQTIKAGKVIIVDEDLKEEYIRKRINRKMDKIIKFMLRILNDEDTTDDDTGLVLDEINRLKGIVINKYKEYLNVNEYKSLLTKLIILEEEFKKNYNQKIFNSYVNNYYVEEVTSSRGR
jgi:23S rRNA G2069 N7-methylase RlmK/C1962 C5-methylase RlmI